MEITFSVLPREPAAFRSMEEFHLDTPFRTAALFIIALCAYHESADASYEMIDMLKGPEKLNRHDRKFIADRMREKSGYLGKAYLSGAEPENNYTPEIPYKVGVNENPYSYAREGYAKLFVDTKGADSPRPVELRKVNDQWFLWNYSSLLSDIRKPVSEEMWN